MSRAKPVSTEIFESIRAMYDYDHTPLNVRLESRDSSQADWIREKVSFDAGYGGERVIAIFFLPRHHAPPFQTVLYYPPSNAFALRSSNDTPVQNLDYLVRSGRAVILPIFRGTYERGDGTDKGAHIETIAYRDYLLAWGKEMRRTVDYLHTRADIDTTRLAYAGTSWGGALGGIMMALEPRFRVGVLSVAGLDVTPSRPEADVMNFLPHVHIPVLMLNAKYDHLVPTETSGMPFFRLLGSPPADKKYVLYEGGHFLPRPQMISESLNWLDKYLGPVVR